MPILAGLTFINVNIIVSNESTPPEKSIRGFNAPMKSPNLENYVLTIIFISSVIDYHRLKYVSIISWH